MKMTLTLCLLLLHSFSYVNAASRDTTRVFFAFNQSSVSEDGKLELKVHFSQIPADSVWLIINGYADYVGNAGKNKALSLARANAVRDYLLALGIKAGAIKTCVGMGTVMHSVEKSGGEPFDRRVDVVSVSEAYFRQYDTMMFRAIPRSLPSQIRATDTGRTFTLDGMYFYINRHTILDESLPLLEALYAEMLNNPRLKIKIEGHVCCIPLRYDDSGKMVRKDAMDFDVGKMVLKDFDTARHLYNRAGLSINRAKVIYYYLFDKGISRDRISYKGFGNTSPLDNNPFDERNKRVEIRVVEK